MPWSIEHSILYLSATSTNTSIVSHPWAPLRFGAVGIKFTVQQLRHSQKDTGNLAYFLYRKFQIILMSGPPHYHNFTCIARKSANKCWIGLCKYIYSTGVIQYLQKLIVRTYIKWKWNNSKGWRYSSGTLEAKKKKEHYQEYIIKEKEYITFYFIFVISPLKFLYSRKMVQSKRRSKNMKNNKLISGLKYIEL